MLVVTGLSASRRVYYLQSFGVQTHNFSHHCERCTDGLLGGCTYASILLLHYGLVKFREKRMGDMDIYSNDIVLFVCL